MVSSYCTTRVSSIFAIVAVYRESMITRSSCCRSMLLTFLQKLESGSSVSTTPVLPVMSRGFPSFFYVSFTVLSSLALSNGAAFSRRAIPDDWIYKGCYLDSTASRSLSGSSYTSTDAMTNDACISFCDAAGYTLAGTEYVRFPVVIYRPLSAYATELDRLPNVIVIM